MKNITLNYATSDDQTIFSQGLICFRIHPTVFPICNSSSLIFSYGRSKSSIHDGDDGPSLAQYQSIICSVVQYSDHLVINSWLFVHSAAEAGARNSNESPPAVVVDDERTPAVAQTGVHLSSFVSGTEHLLVELKEGSCDRAVPAWQSSA